MKECPYCTEEIQEEAIKCRHCGKVFAENKLAGSEEGKGRASRVIRKIISMYNLVIGLFLLKVVIMVVPSFSYFRQAPDRAIATTIMVSPHLIFGILFIVAGINLWRQKPKGRKISLRLHVMLAVISGLFVFSSPYWTFHWDALFAFGLSIFCIMNLRSPQSLQKSGSQGVEDENKAF